MLQFITNTGCNLTPAEQIKLVIDGGCRWVQIRMKDASDDEIRAVFEEIREKAKETDTTIIINDRVELAKELGEKGVAGVHLGQGDMEPARARMVMGPQAIIGVTANTFEQIEAVKSLDIDYIGVGPFADTDTKQRLAPLLGLDGFKTIMNKVREHKIEIPCVAVGGITLSDVTNLLEAGANGIAVSGAIAKADNVKTATEDFIAMLPVND